MSKIKYQDLINYAKNVLNFSQNEEFKTIRDVLAAGRRSLAMREYYEHAAVLVLEALALYVDEQNRTTEDDQP